MKSEFKDYKVLKTSIADLLKRPTFMVGYSAFNNKLLQLELLSLNNNLNARSCIFSIFCGRAAEQKLHTRRQ